MAGYTEITQEADATRLAHRLLEPGRTRPVAVVTVPDGAPSPYIDPEEIADAVGDVCDVYLVPTGALTWSISRVLPDRTQVYGGAGRVYPVDLSWTTDPYSAPLRFAYSADEGVRAVEKLISDALRAGVSTQSRPATAQRHTEGVVQGNVGDSRAMVRLSDGSTAVLWAERVAPCAIDQLVRPGMSLSGTLDPATRRFDVTAGSRVPAAQALQAYEEGHVVLVRVAEIHLDHVLVELLPGSPGRIARDDVTGNPLDALSSLLTVGEVLAARVVRVGSPGGPTWRLGLLDVDDDEDIRPAPSVLRGGPAWLTPGLIGTVQGSAPVGGASPPTAAAAMTLVVPKPGPPGTKPALAGSKPGPPAARPGPPAARPGPPSVEPGPLSVEPGPPTSAAPVASSPGVLEATVPSAPPDSPPAHQPNPGALLGRITELTDAMAGLERRVEELSRQVERNRVQIVRVGKRRDGAGAGSTDAQDESLIREREADRERLSRQEQENVRLQEDNARQRTEVRKAKQEVQRMRKSAHSGGEEPVGPEFTDPEVQFRWEVRQAWARRIPAAEKAALPLGDYDLGPEFLTTLEQLAGVERSKVVEVVVDIATGRVHHLPGRETHQMRVSGAPGSPYRTRDDGATCWRVSLQVNSPGARRLHFWQKGVGPPELSSVRHHDDERA